MASVPIRQTPALLFCVKQREGYWGGSDLSSGLFNSVTFIIQMLTALGVRCQMVQLQDNNKIDAAIKAFQPTFVIIEAFWVVPSKLAQLMKLYPAITFAIRDHSETPFLANEGIAIEWTRAYLTMGIEIMCNSPRAVTDMKTIAQAMGPQYPQLISYAPNYYPIGAPPATWGPPTPHADDTVRVGCFGAVRPLKNQLTQAVAAIQFASQIGRKLEFHINGMRVEQKGDPIVKNLISLFASLPRCTLVTHEWVPHAQFLTIVAQMDFVMQCTFSETFNIVAADAVSQQVPVIASEEIVWLGPYAMADPNNSVSMAQNLFQAYIQMKFGPANNRVLWQWRDLYNYSQSSQNYWSSRFAG